MRGCTVIEPGYSRTGGAAHAGGQSAGRGARPRHFDSARALLGHMVSNPSVAAQQYTRLPRRAWPHRDRRLRACARPRQAFCRSGLEGELCLPGARAVLSCLGRRAQSLCGRSQMDKRDAERARFVVSLFVDAMSPTNSLAGNPAALKKLIETGGASLVQGWRILSAISRATAACRHRSTRANSRWARIWPQRRARWSIATR